MTLTDALIKAAIKALEENRAFLDTLPESVSGVELDIKIDKNQLPWCAYLAPRWASRLPNSCGVPVGKVLDDYQWRTT